MAGPETYQVNKAITSPRHPEIASSSLHFFDGWNKPTTPNDRFRGEKIISWYTNSTLKNIGVFLTLQKISPTDRESTKSRVILLRLFQHTELEHTPKKPLPKGYESTFPFIVGERGIAERVCDIGVCCNFLGIISPTQTGKNHPQKYHTF